MIKKFLVGFSGGGVGMRWCVLGIDRVLLDFTNGRAAMKSKYLGELFPASFLAAPGVLYRDFFMKDRNGVPKGVVNIDLGSLP